MSETDRNQGGYCNACQARREKNKAQAVKQYDKARGSAAKRGYGRKWRKESKAYLDMNPVCAECQKAGYVTKATVVDHIIPHKGDMKLFWRRSTGSRCANGVTTGKPDVKTWECGRYENSFRRNGTRDKSP